MPGVSFAPPVEPPTQVVPAAGRPTAINCPVCGALGQVDPTRRDAEDFCAHCDFPLFWAKDRIPLAEPTEAGDDSLRRLPGALGRVVIASVPCPHCNELNLPTASVCARCGLSMHYVPAPPPAVPPAPLPPPQRSLPTPEPEEPERLWIWWVVLITVFVLAGIGLALAQHWY
jgi:hypothetical protein